MSKHNLAERLRYPSLNGGEVDTALDGMEYRLRTLYAFATAVQNGGYPHDPEEDLCNGIRALYSDWIQFRRTELPEALSIALEDGTLARILGSQH